MELIFSVLVWTISLATVMAGFGGRSFPVQAEYDTTAKFQEVNPSMLLDETNYLVDLSGLYSQCEAAASGQRGEVRVTRKTADGATVYGMVDFVQGGSEDTDSVTAYIRRNMDKWTSRPRNPREENQFLKQIQASNRYGCSVAIGCNGFTVVACMFSSV